MRILGIDPGSTVTGATLTLTVSRSGDNQDASMALHPVALPWGEGVATCGPRGGGQGEEDERRAHPSRLPHRAPRARPRRAGAAAPARMRATAQAEREWRNWQTRQV